MGRGTREGEETRRKIKDWARALAPRGAANAPAEPAEPAEPDWPDTVPALVAADLCVVEEEARGGRRTLWGWLVAVFPGVGTEDGGTDAGDLVYAALLSGRAELSVRQLSERLGPRAAAVAWNRALVAVGYDLPDTCER